MYKIELARQRNPKILPCDIRDAYSNGNRAELREVVAAYRIKSQFGVVFNADLLGIETALFGSEVDESNKYIALAHDVLIGTRVYLLAMALSFLAYFTLFTWWLKGRTPGKLLLGVRVIRLDFGFGQSGKGITPHFGIREKAYNQRRRVR